MMTNKMVYMNKIARIMQVANLHSKAATNARAKAMMKNKIANKAANSRYVILITGKYYLFIPIFLLFCFIIDDDDR